MERSRAFLYSDGVMYDLNSLVSAPFSGELASAVAISDNGQIVCQNGAGQALLLTPVPEPSTIVLGSLAVFGVAV